MIAFMLILYTAAVSTLFKFKILKPQPFPIALTAAAGVSIIGGIVVLWLQAAPISKHAVVTRYVIELVPWVKGQVQSIPAEPNVPLKKGDVLYQIDPAPYQYAVSQATAQLRAAKDNVLQLTATVEAAKAAVARAQADVELAKANLDVAVAIQEANPAAIAKLKSVEAKQKYASTQAELQQAIAAESQARSAKAAAEDNIAVVQAQLDTAQFNLEQCTVRATSDGFVTDWQIRPGTYVTSIPLAAAGTFVDTTETAIAATFPANLLGNVKPGQEVEMTFKSHPGRLFRGKVDHVIQASGEGQFTTGGKLPSAANIGSPGYLAVKIVLDNDEEARELAMGTPGLVAIYTDWGRPFFVISRVTVRMQKWLYFLPLPG